MPKPIKKDERRERLAINLFDLDRMDANVRQMMLVGKVDAKEPVWVDRSRVDETYVQFTCDLLTAASICDVVRARDRRAGDYPTRVCIKRGSWQKLPSAALLTMVENDKPTLHTDVFPPDGMQELVEWSKSEIDLGQSLI